MPFLSKNWVGLFMTKEMLNSVHSEKKLKGAVSAVKAGAL